MDASVFLRLILVGLGIVFLILSVAGAILEMARGTGKVTAKADGNPLEGITKLIDALRALWDTFRAAPMWLALAGVGVLLILLGALLPFPSWMI